MSTNLMEHTRFVFGSRRLENIHETQDLWRTILVFLGPQNSIYTLEDSMHFYPTLSK